MCGGGGGGGGWNVPNSRPQWLFFFKKYPTYNDFEILKDSPTYVFYYYFYYSAYNDFDLYFFKLPIYILSLNAIVICLWSLLRKMVNTVLTANVFEFGVIARIVCPYKL